MGERGAAIEVRNVAKAFHLPAQRVTTLRERALHPLRGRGGRELRALDDISFTVDRGEFFGIMGRNGSGKSTLLKLIASIYRADSGVIRIAGRLAPFIELGVGFHPELPARDNVVMNGVMMGLTPAEARRRYDAVMRFAELEDFEEMKLKNYSSGMRVRLAFAVMVQVDADVLLIDEVLAVGDAAFQERCATTFADLRKAGKTIVLVTHSVASVLELADRAMLLDGGRVVRIGDPEEVTTGYTELNFQAGSARRADAARVTDGAGERRPARVADAWIEDGEGRRAEAIPQGSPIELRAEIEVAREIESAAFGFVLWRGPGRVAGPRPVPLPDDGHLRPGERLRIAATIDNPLTPGDYLLRCALFDRLEGEDVAITEPFAVSFAIAGRPGQLGIVAPGHRVEVTRQEVRELSPG